MLELLKQITLSGILTGVIGSTIVAVGGMLLFNKDKLKSRFIQMFPLSMLGRVKPINTKNQVLSLFGDVFINYKPKSDSKIQLMSNYGGYPEYDAMPKLIDLAKDEKCKINIELAISSNAFQHWAARNTSKLDELKKLDNFKIYLFDNLVPQIYRIGLNSNLEKCFIACYEGSDRNEIVEGFCAHKSNLLFDATEIMFKGFLEQAIEWIPDDLENNI